MNEFKERRNKKSPRLRKMVEKWDKSKKREKCCLFTSLELCLYAEMRKKMTWATLKHCDDGSSAVDRFLQRNLIEIIAITIKKKKLKLGQRFY